MTLEGLLSSICGSGKPGSPPKHRAKPVALRFEPLESRCLLSAAPTDSLADFSIGDFATKGDGIVEYHAVICGIADYDGNQ